MTNITHRLTLLYTLFTLGYSDSIEIDGKIQSIATESTKSVTSILEEVFIMDYLLPQNIHDTARRKLYGQFIPHAEVNCPNVESTSSTSQTNNASAVRCVKCQSLDVCKSLNGFSLQEVYYPDNVDLSGTCSVVESLASAMSKQIFGVGRTFRDIPVCREIVMEYLCRFWGSNNRMYTNCCIFSESSSTDDETIITPRPPCRSFCVQVADLCAYDESFVQLCGKMVCPQTKGSCAEDPTVDGVSLNARLNCSLPYVVNPYKSSAHRQYSCNTSLLLYILLLLAILINTRLLI